MRILYFTLSLGGLGGIQRVTTVKANCFAEMYGNEVAIAFTDRFGWPESAIHPLSSKVKVYDLNLPFYDREPKVSDIFWRFPKKTIAWIRKFKLVMEDFKPDVVISTGQLEKYVLPFVKSTQQNCVFIREYHFASNYRVLESIMNNKENIGVARFLTWCESNILSRFYDCNFLLTRQDLSANKLDKARFDYVWNPTSFHRKMELTAKSKIVLAAGRLTKLKGFVDLIEIWSKTERNGWKLRILGSGPQEDELKSLISRLNLQDCVELAGYCNNVADEMQKASIFVGTSLFEGMMLSLVESMSQGCVPISFKTQYGPLEIIENNKNGFLIDNRDNTLFAEKLSLLIADDCLRKKMAVRAFERSKLFDVEEICNIWMDKYTDLYSAKVLK